VPFAQVNGIDLYFERTGSGPPLLFISGTGGDLRNKPNVFEGPLARSFDLLTYDQRGLGQSDKPDVACSMADYADDAAALMAAQGWDEALVIGVSFGGMVAQELVLRHPQRVKRLVLACTSPGGEGGASFPFHEIEHLKGAARARYLIPISDVRRDDAWAANHPEPYEQLVALGSADTWDRLPQVRRPVMVAAGRHDGIAPAATQEKLAARIPGARLQVFEGGHLFMIQDRTAVPAMAAFLLEANRG
jgi:3-oxoadipate enol-lactonase